MKYVDDGLLSPYTIIPQIEDTCWAATMASMMRYHAGIHTTLNDIVTKAKLTFTSGASVTKIPEYFKGWGIDSTYKGYAISKSKISNEIINHRPIYMSSTSSKGRHGTALIGYQYTYSSSNDYVIYFAETNSASVMAAFYNDNNNHFEYEMGGYTFLWNRTVMLD